MSGAPTVNWIARPTDGGGFELCAPGVGYYTEAPAKGAACVPGTLVGQLLVLEEVHVLRIPDGVSGLVANEPPELRHLPVGYGDVVLRLEPAGDLAAAAATSAAATESGNPVLRAPQAGRFWHRPDPASPAFAATGDTLETGRTLGLLEVMKTFNPVKYSAAGGLPGTAKLVRYLVEDGAEVEDGQPIAEVEDA